MLKSFQAFKRLFKKNPDPHETITNILASGNFDPRSPKLYRALYLNEQIGPERLMISPTDHCNIHCPICWRHKESDENLRALLHQKPLSLELIESIVSDAALLGTKVIDFTGGGEPFTRNDIFDIARIIKKHGLQGSLTTNGTLIDASVASSILDSGLDDMCFSIDSTHPETNSLIRGEGVLEKTLHALRLISQLKGQRQSAVPIIRISTVITSKNYQDLESILELSHSLGVVAVNFSLLVEWETNQDFWVRDRENEVKAILLRVTEHAQHYGIYTNAASILEYGLGPHQPPSACFAPWLMAFVNASGTVLLCCTLASQYSNEIGNVYEQRFIDIWTGERMKLFRKRIMSGVFPPECRLCIPEFTRDFTRIHEEIETIRKAVKQG